MTAAVPSPVDRKLYGDLADDIVLLRSDGRIVARFKAGFRVDSWPEIFTAAQVRGMAAEVRNRRQARKPDAPRAPMARHEIERVPGAGDLRAGVAGTAEINDRPGSPSAEHTADVRDKFWRAVGPTKLQGPMPNAGDGGETAATRCRPSPITPYSAGPEQGAAGNSPPPDDAPQAARSEEPTATPAPAVGASAGTDICGCGKPQSRAHGRCWFRRRLEGPVTKRAVGPTEPRSPGCLASDSVAPEPVVPTGNEGSLGERGTDARLAALEAELAAFKATVRAAVADLVAHIGLGDGR